MGRAHIYEVMTTWTGNLGGGTADYRAYSRDHEVTASAKQAPILCSSDIVFRGDGTRYNPEELLVASLSTCHMLWMLHLCADAGIVVTAYADRAWGTMIESEDGGGEFTEVTLNPRLTITDESRAADLEALHHNAAGLCFIARSVKFPVRHKPSVHFDRR